MAINGYMYICEKVPILFAYTFTYIQIETFIAYTSRKPVVNFIAPYRKVYSIQAEQKSG